jgi:3-methyladenine DNA glycosylase AlkD
VRAAGLFAGRATGLGVEPPLSGEKRTTVKCRGKSDTIVAPKRLFYPGRLSDEWIMRFSQPAIFTVALALATTGLSAEPPADKPASRRPRSAEAGVESPIADLIEALKDPSILVRRRAAQQLGAGGTKAASAVPALTAALKGDKEPAVRASVAEALGGIKTAARAAIPSLLAALKDSDALVRETAAEALADINADAKTVVPALVKLLDDSDREVRCAAATAIGDFGIAAREAIPDLQKALKDKHPFVREAAADALKAIQMAGRKLDS